LPSDGEIDPIYVIEQAWLRGKQVYLPVLQPLRGKLKNSLYFAPFEPGSIMRANKYGIQEPAIHPSNWLRAQQIDLMLVPLVAFDAGNNRLGMGGGFYDRSLAHRNIQQRNTRPYLIGLAHELQKTNQLPVENWDIRMDAIATENGIQEKSGV
jgi:5-formyltetrahydrofolate cyclo-ligase